MTFEEAIQTTIKRFPFEGYISAVGATTGAYATIATATLRYLRHGNRILDFGCGPCDKTAVLQFLDFQCSGYDDLQDPWHTMPGSREKILAFAKECGIDFRLGKDGVLPFEKRSFDMVLLNDVLEHLHDSPRDVLNDLLELVKPEGLLLVTVPNAVNIRKRIDVFFGNTNLPRFESYYWCPGPWRGHIREYVRDDLVKLAEYLNLEVLDLKACDHMLEKLPAAVRPVYLFVTKIFTGWKDSWLLVARKRPGWVSRKALPGDELARILGKSPAS